MVRISSTGDILPDDNRSAGSSNRPSNNSSGAQRRQGSVRHENYNQQEQAAMQGGGGVSVFDAFNQRLLALGIPRWNAGSYVIEPIVSVAFLLAGLFLGLPGILMGLVLFAVVKLSQSGGIPGMDYLFGLGRNQDTNRPSRGNSDRRPRGGGRGHRLGSS